MSVIVCAIRLLTGQGPGGFKLQDGVGTAQELDESVDDAAFDDPIYWRVLLLGKQSFNSSASLSQHMVISLALTS